jgi:hypothetical protein
MGGVGATGFAGGGEGNWMAGATLSGAAGFMGAGTVPLNSAGVTAVFGWYRNVNISPNAAKKAAANIAIHGMARRARGGWASLR